MDDALAEQIHRAAAAMGLDVDDRQLDAFGRYADLVGKWQYVTNLTGAREAEQFVSEHLIDCLSLVPHLAGGRVLDLGSGAGLPGIVLAIARGDLALTLLEPRSRRARFLTQVRIELGLNNVEVVCARAESWHGQVAQDYIVSRAFGSLPAFARAAQHLRSPATALIAMKGAVDPAELAAAERIAGASAVVRLDVPGFSNRHLVVFGSAEQPVGLRASSRGEWESEAK
ncbi:MAG: 16S rRNA (guanine(527)-N(7))-methyltransferase RsmG [Gammaproteobacteria bacterium]